ncbi:MAG: hypothetical protein VX378_04580 [Pseudomonadota bacterium]|nr:hypothetical protein [Pseudomonadota bacterium]
MTIAAWPASLPKPVRSTYGSSWSDPRQNTSVGYGAPSTRLRSSAVPQSVALSVKLARDEKAVFERFWQDDLRWGSLPFTMPDPTTDGWALLAADGSPVLDNLGEPILLSHTWTCLFAQDSLPQESMQGLTFNISFNVVVMP